MEVCWEAGRECRGEVVKEDRAFGWQKRSLKSLIHNVESVVERNWKSHVDMEGRNFDQLRSALAVSCLFT